MIVSIHLITLLGLGFALGLKHALDADHVVAVSTIVSQTKSLKKSSLFGAIWGAGHTTTLLIVGLILLGLKLTIPKWIALSFEFLVGIVLVLLGLNVIWKLISEKLHYHKHTHASVEHTHVHSHKTSSMHDHFHKSFAVGMVHGLAGSATLMLLVLGSVTSLVEGVLYILVFGIGSIFGMLVVSTIIGLPFMLTTRFEAVHNSVKIVAGSFSILLGFTIMYEIGYINGLLL